MVEKGSLGGWGIAQQAVQSGVNAHKGPGSSASGEGELEYVVGGVGGRGREVPPVHGKACAVWHGEAVLDEDAGNRILPWPADGGAVGERG